MLIWLFFACSSTEKDTILDEDSVAQDNDGDGLIDSEDDDEFGDPREYATKVAVKKIAQDILNEIMTSW